MPAVAASRREKTYLIQTLTDHVWILPHLLSHLRLTCLGLLSHEPRLAHFAHHAFKLFVRRQEHLDLVGVGPRTASDTTNTRFYIRVKLIVHIDLSIQFGIVH
jgi:hypothetical protein